MTISAISRYPGGAVDDVAPLARMLKANYLKYGVGYRLSRFETGPGAADRLVIVSYADAAACERAQKQFAEDQELQRVFAALAKFEDRVSREMAVDIDL
jgi:hypothetical protein